jgi:hypothetical protein
VAVLPLGNGASRTKLVYLLNEVAAVFSCSLAIIAGTIVYCAIGKAYEVYRAGVSRRFSLAPWPLLRRDGSDDALAFCSDRQRLGMTHSSLDQC